ncbi:hypothetical protein [Paenibacillus jamilae]|uniref:hypothetical protein n=1 Tax=Paenibacillus jamilae TaxID=114136 RepID=UPI000B193127|nr:hypothetical protein [Paenibacillus jamilae]
MSKLTPNERQELEQLRSERAYTLEQLQAVKEENERLKRHAEVMANRIDMWTRVGG